MHLVVVSSLRVTELQHDQRFDGERHRARQEQKVSTLYELLTTMGEVRRGMRTHEESIAPLADARTT